MLKCGALMMVMSLAFAAPTSVNAQEADAESEPVRAQRSSAFAFTANFIFSAGKPAPLPGIRYTIGLSESVGLTLDLQSLAFVNVVTAGVNWHITSGAWSPYLYGRAGGVIVLAYFLGTGVVAEAGAGIEYASDGGFSVGLEAGPMLFGYTDGGGANVGLDTSLTIGYRF